jgi:hypothetical protein
MWSIKSAYFARSVHPLLKHWCRFIVYQVSRDMGNELLPFKYELGRACLLKRGLPIRGLPKRGLPKRGLPKRGLPKRGLPKRGLPKRGLPKRGLPKRGLPKRGLPKRGLPKRGLPKRGRRGSVFLIEMYWGIFGPLQCPTASNC